MSTSPGPVEATPSSGPVLVRDLGEFGLIDQVVAGLPQDDRVLLGPGDDAAVLAAPDRRVVVTTDMLVEDQHFRRDWSTAYQVGRKAAAANLADVAAMGAVPTALVVAVGVPGELPAAWVLDLSAGLRDEAAIVGASVVGGDTVAAERVVVSVTALGDLQGRPPITRSGARPGDLLVLAGSLGRSAAGLDLLRAGERSGALVDSHRVPTPPYATGPALARAGARAMCDVSDGLLADLGHLAQASGVCIEVDASLLVVDPELATAGDRLGIPALTWVLTGGEDHALVAAIDPVSALPLVGPTGGLRAGVRVIGAVHEGNGVVVRGGPAGLRTAGFEHFAARPSAADPRVEP
ncbi:MAG: thiamine-phosphate kinase [Actinomycetes bacterium]